MSGGSYNLHTIMEEVRNRQSHCKLLRTQLDKFKKENFGLSNFHLLKLNFKVFFIANFLREAIK